VIDSAGVLRDTTLHKSTFVDDVIGANVKDMLDQEQAEVFMGALDTALQTGKRVCVDYSLGKQKHLYHTIIDPIDRDTAYVHEIEIRGDKDRAKYMLRRWVDERRF